MIWKLIGFHRMINAVFNESWVIFGLPEACASHDELLEQMHEG